MAVKLSTCTLHVFKLKTRIYQHKTKSHPTTFSAKYNLDKYNASDGLALKQCETLAALVEASLSISHGIKSKELINVKKEILKSFREIQGVNFKAIANQIDQEFSSTGQTQTQIDFD